MLESAHFFYHDNYSTMQRNLPDHLVLAGVLEKLDTEIMPSEVHATACGLLSTNNSAMAQTWLYNLWPDKWPQASAEDPSDETLQTDLHFAEATALFNELHEITRNQLNDPSCELVLLLPDDDDDIEDRVNALGDWCQGFLVGLTLGGVSDFKPLPEDAQEIIQDMVQIARAGASYQIAGNEEDEHAYTELVEYLRVGVLLLNEELQPTRPASVASNTETPTQH